MRGGTYDLSDKITKYLGILNSLNRYYKLDNTKYMEFSSRYRSDMNEDEKQELINELRIVIDTIWQTHQFHNLQEIYENYTKLNNRGGSLKTRVKKIKKY